jgi:hypothetical protein
MPSQPTSANTPSMTDRDKTKTMSSGAAPKRQPTPDRPSKSGTGTRLHLVPDQHETTPPQAPSARTSTAARTSPQAAGTSAQAARTAAAPRPSAAPRTSPAAPRTSASTPRTSTAGSAGGVRGAGEHADVYAARTQVGFTCPGDHLFDLTFAHDADVPTQWDCPRCGQMASRGDGTPAVVPPTKPLLSHWDRLLQRRSMAELEALVADRLREIRQAARG